MDGVYHKANLVDEICCKIQHENAPRYGRGDEAIPKLAPVPVTTTR